MFCILDCYSMQHCNNVDKMNCLCVLRRQFCSCFLIIYKNKEHSTFSPKTWIRIYQRTYRAAVCKFSNAYTTGFKWAFLHSRLCNRSVLNAAADRITGCRSESDMAVLTYEVLYGGAPRYLCSLVRVADLHGWPAVRSVGSRHLVVPPVKLSSLVSAVEPSRSLLCTFGAASAWQRLSDKRHISAESLSVTQTFYVQMVQLSWRCSVIVCSLIVTPVLVLAVAVYIATCT